MGFSHYSVRLDKGKGTEEETINIQHSMGRAVRRELFPIALEECSKDVGEKISKD